MAGGKSGARGPMPREVQVSKKMSWLLRHGAEKEGLQLGEGGYISVKDVLSNRNIRSLKVTFDEVRQIVSENDKQRFSLIHKSAAPSTAASIPTDDAATQSTQTQPARADGTSADPADYLIRANQGHSLAVASEELLTPVDAATAPGTVVHGTTHSAWHQILATGGLKRMTRTHVHFASGLPAGFKSIADVESAKEDDEKDDADACRQPQPAVISGMRNSSSILVFLDIRKALDAGLRFWTSENGVVLSEGDEDGVIGLQFFARVEDRTGGLGVLVKDGVVVKEAPEAWASKGGGRRGGRGGRGGGRGGSRGSGKGAAETTLDGETQTTKESDVA
ncbi:hypothetical protein MBLNU459_g1668t1 [Dothideomycetes sp. NU459]